jgi:2-haloacid dehalogenase
LEPGENALKLEKKLIVFDAYGTLFDVYSVWQTAESLYPQMGMALAQLWRDKQIDYTRIISLSDPHAVNGSRFYEPFWDVTQKALRYSAQKLHLELGPSEETQLMNAYDQLKPFEENIKVLQALRALGLKTAILSNANPEMLERVSAHAKMSSLFDQIVSVDRVRQFKTHPSTYGLIEPLFSVEKNQILFISSNDWDALGATWFGWDAVWLNRQGAPKDHLGPEVRYTLNDLNSVLNLF